MTNIKAVIQKDLSGKQIAKFNSISDASRATGIDPGNISAAIHEGRHTAGNFIWEELNSVKICQSCGKEATDRLLVCLNCFKKIKK